MWSLSDRPYQGMALDTKPAATSDVNTGPKKLCGSCYHEEDGKKDGKKRFYFDRQGVLMFT